MITLQKKLGILSSVIILAACGGGSNNNENQNSDATTQIAVVQTVAADFSGSNMQTIDLDTFEVSGGLLPRVESDYFLEVGVDTVFQIGRFNIDLISAYNEQSISSSSALYEYSLLDTPEDPTSNVHAMAIVSDTKAYLIPYGSNTVWIVNPSAENEDSFKIGELDLSPYADSDGLVEAETAIIVDGLLYIAMQRLDRDNGFSPVANSAWIAVFDIATDEEVDTNLNDAVENLRGIELDIQNVQHFSYHEDAGLFLQGIGDPWGGFSGRPVSYGGGIVKIDTVDFSVELVLDDGTPESHPYDYIANVVVLSEEVGYFVGLAGFQSTTLYRFNPQTGDVYRVDGAMFNSMDITSLQVAPNGEVWVGIGFKSVDGADDVLPQIARLDPSNVVTTDGVGDELATVAHMDEESIGLLQNPTLIRFLDIED